MTQIHLQSGGTVDVPGHDHFAGGCFFEFRQVSRTQVLFRQSFLQ